MEIDQFDINDFGALGRPRVGERVGRALLAGFDQRLFPLRSPPTREQHQHRHAQRESVTRRVKVPRLLLRGGGVGSIVECLWFRVYGWGLRAEGRGLRVEG